MKICMHIAITVPYSYCVHDHMHACICTHSHMHACTLAGALYNTAVGVYVLNANE